MKRIGKFFGLLALVVAVGSASAQTVSVNIVRPLSNGLLAQNDLYVAATISSTYEIQSVQATIDGLTASLAYTTAAYSNCPGGVCLPQPGWSNTISLAGLTWGAKTLTVTAIDVFGNSNSAQRSIVHDLPPTLTVMAPADATVARPEVVVSATAADDDSSGTQIDVFQGGVGGPVLASGTNALNTTLNFSGADGGIVTLCFRALDSVGQAKLAYRQVYVQSSSNLVEIANVSEGRIIDAQPDRLLFQTNQNYSLPPDSWVSQALKIKSRANGVETLAFVKTNMSVGSGFLSPDGVVLVAGGSPYAGFVTGYGLFQSLGNVEILYGTHGLVPINLVRHGNFAAWGWGNALGFYPQIYLTDLQTTNTLAVTNDLGAGDVRFDLAANGDIVFAPVNGYGSHLIYRFRAGTNALLASISGDHNQSTNQLVAPKTDGSNVFYVQITPTNHMLKKISAGGEVKLTEGLTIGSDYLISNGWVAYGRNGGGQTQIWRCSPAGDEYAVDVLWDQQFVGRPFG